MPPGFVVAASSYHGALEENGLESKIRAITTSATNMDDSAALQSIQLAGEFCDAGAQSLAVASTGLAQLVLGAAPGIPALDERHPAVLQR